MYAIAIPTGGHDPNGDEPVLVFNRYENRYRLREIWNSETRGSSLVTRSHRKSAEPARQITDRVLITASAGETR